MISVIGWIITSVSLLGTVLNVKKNILCFYVWALANLAWIWYDAYLHLHSRMVLDAIQLGMAFWGIAAWSKKAPTE